MNPELDLINRVARDMTDAHPRGDFRVRVIAKLPSSRTQPVWHYATVAFGGLALGVMIMFGMNSRTPQNPASPSPSVAPRIPVASGRATPGVTPVSAGRPSPTRSSGPMEAIGPLGPVGPNEGAFQILSISPIQPTELSIAPIVVGPLVLSPVNNGGQRK